MITVFIKEFIQLFLRYVIIAVLVIGVTLLFSGKTKASNTTAITVDASQNLGQMPGIAAVGVELSQWGNDFSKSYFRKKYEEDIENAGSIYRTGLNLRYHVSDLSNDIQKYMDHLNDFNNTTLLYKKEGVDLIFTVYGMPKWLSKRCVKNRDGKYICGPNWGATPPTDYDAWAEHVKGIVSYYKYKLGLDLWYEIWNEPDQGYLFSNTDFWFGSQEEYFKLYKYSVKGALEADPHVKIGGPASSVWDNGAIEEFIKYAATNNLPIDFITWHMYAGWNNFWGTKSEYREMSDTIRKWLKQYGYDENTPLIINEWNSNASLNDLEDHNTEQNSAYAVYAVFNMLETGIDKQAFFNIADFERNSIFSGNPGIMSNDGIIKSVYNAFKALSVLQGKQENEITNRLKADIASEDGFVAAIASQTKDNRKVRMLISNYIPSNRMLKNAFPQKTYPYAFKYRKIPRKITMNFKNIPFSGDAIMTTYLIDKDHSNSCKYNKITEEIQTDTPCCGNNGMVDKLVMQAKIETQEKALSEAIAFLKYKGYQQSQIDIIATQLRNCFQINSKSIFKDCISPLIELICSQVMSLGSYPPDCAVFEQDVIDCNNVYHNTYDNLYFSGEHTSFTGQAINVSMWIDKINNDPNISLEGSKQTKQINITNGLYQETLTLQPYSVALVEIIIP